MKVHQLFESDDEGIRKFHKKLGDEIRASVAANAVMVKQHKWKYDVGDVLLSIKTGKTYKLTSKFFTKYQPKDDNFKNIGEPRMVAAYHYEADGGEEKGSFLERLMLQKKTLKLISKAGKPVDED